MGFFKEESPIPPLYEHQAVSKSFILNNNRVYDASDPGTGKTRSSLEAFTERRRNGGGKILVLAPKKILKPAWGNDANFFVPDMEVSIAYASNRKKAFDAEADFYVTNHDAVKWIAANAKDYLDEFDGIIVDEITAFKHRTSQRAKALKKIMPYFEYRVGLSGTPIPNGVCDIWHQMLLIDDGDHLGTNFFKFRNAVCEPVQTGPGPDMINWVDKEGAAETVADILDDITIRNKFEECIDIPPNTISTVNFELSAKHLAQYKRLHSDQVLDLESGVITAVHAGVVANKLLQLASGAVYDEEHVAQVITTERYELVMELIKQRKQCVCAFLWKHQKEQLCALADKEGLSYYCIDGESTNEDEVNQAVTDFQAGKIRIIFAHPKSAGHGLTLTKGTTTIWPSPTTNAEWFEQFNRRIYRSGQKEKTETLLVCAENTVEGKQYENLQTKLDRMTSLLKILELNSKENAA